MTDGGSSSKQTSERILEIALSVLASGGLDAVTVRRVADGAGVSVSVVHHHFGSKQGLLDACKTDFYTRAFELIVSVIQEAEGKPPRETLDLLMRDLFSFSRNNLGVLRLLARDILADGRLIKPFRGYDRRPFFKIADNLIGPSLGLTTELARVRLQAVSVLLVRFAVSTDDDLEALLGYSGDAAIAAAEDHVVAMTQLLLLGS